MPSRKSISAILAAVLAILAASSYGDIFFGVRGGRLIIQTTSESNVPRINFIPTQLVLDENAIDFTPTLSQGTGVTWSASGLPAGASINSSTGQVTGTLSTLGKSNALITATNGSGSQTRLVHIHVYDELTTIDAAWLTANGPAPYPLTSADNVYRLSVDVTTDSTAFHPRANNITLDLNTHVVTFDNLADTDIDIVNGDFETGDSTGWDLSGASGAVVEAGSYNAGQVYETGGKALKLVVPTGATHTVVTTGSVTFTSGRMYVLRLGYMMGVTGTITLKQQGGANTLTISTAQTRGGTIRELVFVAASTATAPLEIAATQSSGSTQNIWIDLVAAERCRRVGIALYPTGHTANFVDGATTPLSPTGSCQNFSVIGGSIIQGAAGSHDCSAIYTQSITGCCARNVTLSTTGTCGSHGHTIWGQNAIGITIEQCTINNSSRYISSREQRYGTSLMLPSSTGAKYIGYNTFNGSGYSGIVLNADSTGNTTVEWNNISIGGYYTNANGITWDDFTETSVTSTNICRYNTIDNTGSGDGGRGIHLIGTKGLQCHGNTVRVRDQGLNQETGSGFALNGAYGIQFEEDAEDTELYDNHVTAYSQNGSGSAGLRISFSGTDTSGNSIHDNTFIAEGDGTAPGQPAIALLVSVAGLDGDDATTLVDNIFKSNERLVEYDGADLVVNWSVYRNSWEKTAGGHVNFNNFMKVKGTPPTDDPVANMRYVDQIYLDAEAETAFESMVINYSSNGATEGGAAQTVDTVQLAWTITIHVTTGGSPEVGAAISVVDANTATEVASGTTDASGNVVVELDEYRYASGAIGSQRAYDVKVNTIERQADYIPTDTSTLNIAF